LYALHEPIEGARDLGDFGAAALIEPHRNIVALFRRAERMQGASDWFGDQAVNQPTDYR
jgi:hypothetical protein